MPPPDRATPTCTLAPMAPWLKLADAVDYLRRVGPRVAVPVHEKVLSAVGIRSHYGQLEQLGGQGSFQVLDDGRTFEL